MFDKEKAFSFILKKDWDGLRSYLLTFIQSNPHFGLVHFHPGLLFTAYEIQLIEMMKEEKYESAMDLFNGSVSPLISRTDDNLFAPLDLRDRISTLKIHLKNRALPPDASTNQCVTAFFDYIYLYFPQCIRPLGKDWHNSLLEFVMVFEDSSGRKRYRCLACQWVMPTNKRLTAMQHHIKHKRCPRLTLYLLRRMSKYLGYDDELPDLASTYKRLPSKRKHVEIITGSLGIDSPGHVGNLISIVGEIARHNFAIVEILSSNSSPVASEIRGICMKQHTMIQEMEKRCYDDVEMEKKYIMGHSSTLLDNSLNILLLEAIPARVYSKALELDRCIFKLRKYCFKERASRFHTS